MRAILSRSVGRCRVHAVVDAEGPLDTTFGEAFSTATPEERAAAHRLDPTAFGPDDRWRLPFRVYVVEAPGERLTLVDLGVGHARGPAASWAPVPGSLPDRLADLGIGPADVDLVVLTHLHEDHVGWVVGPDGRPLFANAEHVVQRAEVAAIAEDRVIRRATVDPLTEAGLLRQVHGSTNLLPGLDVEPTPGHTPGHQSAWLSSGDDVLLLTGDVLVHAVQLVAPHVAYAAEDDPDEAAATRHRIFAEAKRRGAPLATAHLTDAFLPLPQ